MNADILLTYLERCSPRNEAWRSYIRSRVPEVLTRIARLRHFAGLRPGRVCDLVNAQADTLSDRLYSLGGES